MKRQIRRGVFESNSSSTHALNFLMENDYNRWDIEDLYLFDGSAWCWDEQEKKPHDNCLYTKDEVIEFCKNSKYPWEEIPEDEQSFNEGAKEDGFYAYSEYWNDNLEPYERSYTTPLGETVIAFGYYGFDC